VVISYPSPTTCWKLHARSLTSERRSSAFIWARRFPGCGSSTAKDWKSTLCQIAPPQELVSTVTKAIRDDRPDAAVLAAALYRHSSPLPQHATVAAGVGWSLFNLPVSALVEEPGLEGAPVYVAERHTVELIPGVAYWLESSEHPGPRLSSLFVGVETRFITSRIRVERRLRKAYPKALYCRGWSRAERKSKLVPAPGTALPSCYAVAMRIARSWPANSGRIRQSFIWPHTTWNRPGKHVIASSPSVALPAAKRRY
jgi:hypothetical protein